MFRPTMLCIFLAAWLAMSASHAQAQAEPLKVMSFNIRYNNAADGVNAWPNRKDWVAEIVQREKPDLLGLQEALAGQIKDLETRLEDYAWYGVGREDGKAKGEYVPIFYRKERFDVLDRGQFWLSETPDEPGSKSWDTSITRLVTWLKLKDKASERELFVANTHYDHIGAKARHESSKLILDKFPKLAGDLPVILTGDFNSGVGSDPYKAITGQGAASTWFLADTRKSSEKEPEGPDSTWNGFRRILPGQQIDFIFTRGLKTESHAILTDEKDGRFPSDHLPVMAVVK
jgi:endonuclease/exonuclease/phosphatase family metal-dependent hydrolase